MKHLLTITLVLSLPGLLDRDGIEFTDYVDGFDSVSGCLTAGARWAARSEHWIFTPNKPEGWILEYYCMERIGLNTFHYPPDASPEQLRITFEMRADIRNRLGLPEDEVTL